MAITKKRFLTRVLLVRPCGGSRAGERQRHMPSAKAHWKLRRHAEGGTRTGGPYNPPTFTIKWVSWNQRSHLKLLFTS